MKKLILALFLILTAFAYSTPSFVDTKRVENKGYKVMQDEDTAFTFQKIEEERVITITYWIGVKNPDAKELNAVLKQDAITDLKHEGSLKLGKAYVEKYSDANGFMYTIVFKNAKPSDVLTSIAVYAKNEVPKNEVNKLTDKMLAESETFIK